MSKLVKKAKKTIRKLVAKSAKSTVKQSHPQLRKALQMLAKDRPATDARSAIKMVIWELMKLQTTLNGMKAK
jgi:hypothetical protein